jgi:hypothetical protein
MGFVLSIQWFCWNVTEVFIEMMNDVGAEKCKKKTVRIVNEKQNINLKYLHIVKSRCFAIYLDNQLAFTRHSRKKK